MIVFKNIKWRNILSTGNEFTEISMNSHETTLISGKNGSGKSTLIEALSYVLYGKSFRNINLPQLVNNVNAKELEVHCEFSQDGKEYFIKRGMKPKLFEIYINGILHPQSANVYDYQDFLENNVLRIKFKTFIQIIVLGDASFTPFMLLTTQARRDIIESLLDIDVFSRMNVILKVEQKKIETAIQELKSQERLFNSRIALIEKHVEEQKSFNEQHIASLRRDVESNECSIFNFEKTKAEKQTLLDSLQRSRGVSLEEINKKLIKTSQTQEQLARKEEKILEDISRFANLENCPTCQQDIEFAHKECIKSAKNETIQKIQDARKKLSRQLQATNEMFVAASKIQKEMDVCKSDIAKQELGIAESTRNIEKLNKDIAKFENAKKEIDLSDLVRHKEGLVRIIAKRNEMIDQGELYTVAGTLLKDGGIKTTIISQYIPVMNKLINKYLEQMDFFCLFEIDENFKETMKAVYKDELSYTSLSQGERMRVDIALLFTWREIARMRNASITNILILDEIMDSALDASGTEEFLNIIKKLAKSSKIFVISHKSDAIIDKFDRSIHFKKTANFSEIVMEA